MGNGAMWLMLGAVLGGALGYWIGERGHLRQDEPEPDTEPGLDDLEKWMDEGRS